MSAGSKGSVRFRTPLKQAVGLGSAKSGTHHFIWQRATAIILALLTPWLIGLLVSLVGADVSSIHRVLGRPANAVLLSVFVVALFWHARLGVQVVIEDYVSSRAWEIALQIVVLLGCAIGVIAALYAIARVALLAN